MNEITHITVTKRERSIILEALGNVIKALQTLLKGNVPNRTATNSFLAEVTVLANRIAVEAISDAGKSDEPQE